LELILLNADAQKIAKSKIPEGFALEEERKRILGFSVYPRALISTFVVCENVSIIPPTII